MKQLLIAAAAAALLASCVNLNVKQAKGIRGETICVIDNPRVPGEFRLAYERQLQARGYATRVVQADDGSCRITSGYSASYGFHWGVYLSAASLRIYDKGVEIGSANYRAPYASPQKHGRVESKIEAMVAELLP